MPHKTLQDNGVTVQERNMHGIAVAMGMILALFGDTSVTEKTRPRLIWDNVNPPDQAAPDGSLAICLVATVPEDVLWHRESSAWVKLASLSSILLNVPTDVTLTAGGDAVLTKAVHTLRGAGGMADDLVSFSGAADGERFYCICGAEVITLKDGATLATPRNADIVLQPGDWIAGWRNGTVYTVELIFAQAGYPDTLLAAIPDAGNFYTQTGLAAMLQELFSSALGGTSSTVRPYSTAGLREPPDNEKLVNAIGNEMLTRRYSNAHLVMDETSPPTAIAGRGMVVGCAVSPQGAPDNTVAVASGTTINNAGLNDISTVTPVLAATTPNPLGGVRNDIVVSLMGIAAPVIIEGTVATVDPVLPVGCVPLARLRCAMGAFTLAGGDIDDLRQTAQSIDSNKLLPIPDAGNFYTQVTLALMLQELFSSALGGTSSTVRTYHATPLVLANNDTVVAALAKVEAWLQALRLTLPIPADVTVTDPGGDLAFNASAITIRGFGGGADAVITCSGLRDGETATAVCGAEAITLTDGATLSLERDQNLVLATGDIVAITRHGAVYFVKPLFVQLGVATSAGGTGATGNTAVRGQTHLGALAAAGVAYHAAYVGGAGAIDDAVGPWVQCLPTRTVQITANAATVAANWTIDMQFADGGGGTDIIAHPGGAVTATGTKAGRITRVRSSVDPGAGASVLVETGPGAGIGVKDANDIVVGVDGVVEAPASSDAPSGTVTPNTAPNAAHVYDVRYRVDHNHTGPSHSHQA